MMVTFLFPMKLYVAYDIYQGTECYQLRENIKAVTAFHLSPIPVH